MGSVETYCQLCGVSFAIARCRTANEPLEASWPYYGEGFVEEESGQDETACKPESESGCSTRLHEGNDEAEHIAGPGCQRTNAYSGVRISRFEMKGCRAIIALIKKYKEFGGPWQDEEDDQPWERETNYFLSGVGDGSPDEDALEDFDRIRHGVSSVYPSNSNRHFTDSDLVWAIPVHPTCWEIFERLSNRLFGFIDVHGLWMQRENENEYEDFHIDFPRHPAVRLAREQWWLHQLGSEWLAANPIDIPGFPQILYTQSLVCKDGQEPHFSIHDEAFTLPHPRVMVKGKDDDAFASLPAELRIMIFAHLDTKSIANMRLVSRAWRPMPKIVFRNLLLTDMPWLWEAEDLPIERTNWSQMYVEAKFIWSHWNGFRNRIRICKDVSEILRRIGSYRRQGRIRGLTGWEADADDMTPSSDDGESQA